MRQMLKVAYQTIAWRGDLKRALEDLRDLGFTRFESGNLYPWVLRHRDDLEKLIDETGVAPVAAYIGGAYIYPEDRAAEMRVAEVVCEFLAQYECRYIVVGGGHVRPEGSSDDDYESLANALHEIAKLAKSHSLQLCYHPHQGTMVETSEQIDLIAELTRRDLVYFCFDVAHIAAAGGDPVQLIAKHFERLAYIHLKDIDDAGHFVELGKGTLDLPAIVAALEETGFSGPIVLELDHAENPRAAAEHNRDYALKHLGLSL